ncbi:receptor-type tyrosine-protein phosphatase F-like, partial [Mizuhopecten yessoensis]|uniref:receptor-type tyrosine-protein phosphatase F-like n=1 Tax=Mizuhopecten yessoensis TaxID=6573 RepID=UPI000B45E0DF
NGLIVTSLAVGVEGTSTVTIHWVDPSPGSDQVNRYEVHWTPPLSNGTGNYDAGKATSVRLTGFVSGQQYTFYVKSIETGSRATQQEVQTSDKTITIKPSTPSGFTATDVDGPQITLSWSLPSGIKTSYDVTTTPVLSPTTTSTESITYTVNVLDGQRYNISITTVSGSERSDPLLATFRTVSKTPNPPTGVGCNVNLITDQTITLTWTAPVYPNGDIQHYIVNSNTTTAMFPTSTNLTEFTVDGLVPETSYVFSVATVNDAVMPHSNLSQYSSQMGCPTKAAMSLKPSTLVVSQEQSRQFTLNWAKPTVTNGDLRGYRLTVLDGSTCVQEVIFTCTTCPGYMAFPFKCHEAVRQTVTILPADLDSYTYTVGNLLPYINYTASVVAVNAAGDGHPNTQYAMTDQEVPQHPTTLTATVVSSTKINVNWDISDPKPGPTTYTLYIIAVAPESSRTQTIPGFSVRSYKVVGLQEYRTYTFNLTASTAKGLAVFQQALPSAKTLAAAPGAVSNFMVARPDGPNYTTVRVSWELPAVLERNSDIIKFMFLHNTSEGNLNAVPEEVPIDTNLNTVIRNLAVLPHNTYYIEVYAVGTNSNGDVYNGIKSINTYIAPAGLAALSEVCGIGSSPVDCQNVVTSSCTASNTQGVTVCRCNLGHFDSNGYDVPGGTCVSMSTVRVNGVTSSGAVDTSTATISWVPPPDQSHVSRYTVVWRVSGSTAIDGSFNAGKSKYASITGLEHDTTYVFTVKTVETGSRIEPQDIESDASVTITTNTSITPWVAVFVVALVLSILFFVTSVYFWNRSRRTEGKATDESHYATPSRIYNNSDMHLYNLTADERQVIQNEQSQTQTADYKNVNIYDTAP